MPNRHRGEAAIMIDGREHPLRLTLGALAELETAFGAGDLAALGERFAGGRPSARDLAAILGAGLRGAGADLSDADVARLAPDGGLPAIVAAVADLLALTFGDTEAGEGDPSLPPPVPPRHP